MSSNGMKVLIGTTKGVFLLSGGSDRSGWNVRGPFCDGWPINHVVGDPATGSLWAGGGGDWHGAGVWHSGDGGETWDGPVNVNDQPKVAREGLHGMAMGTDGLIFCTWLDLRKENTQIFGASSRDGGKSWSKNHLVYASPSGTVLN